MAFTEWISAASGLTPDEFKKNILNEGNNTPEIDQLISKAFAWAKTNRGVPVNNEGYRNLVKEYLTTTRDYTGSQKNELNRKYNDFLNNNVDANKRLQFIYQQPINSLSITASANPAEIGPISREITQQIVDQDTGKFIRQGQGVDTGEDVFPIIPDRARLVQPNEQGQRSLTDEAIMRELTPSPLIKQKNQEVINSEAAANAKGRKPRGATPEVPIETPVKRSQDSLDPNLLKYMGQQTLDPTSYSTQFGNGNLGNMVDSPTGIVDSDPTSRTRRPMPNYLKRAIGSGVFNTLAVPFLLSRANRLRGESQNLRKILAQQTPERTLLLSQLPVTGLPSPSIPIPCLLYTSPSPRDRQKSRMPSSA